MKYENYRRIGTDCALKVTKSTVMMIHGRPFEKFATR
jgi:hypothetical protein